MSRPDEGLIHAWLDGELDAAEAARIAALVEHDPEWAAAAAEARGLIAASARIVSALDDVPMNVLPRTSTIHPPPSNVSRHWWRRPRFLATASLAATMLILVNVVPPKRADITNGIAVMSPDALIGTLDSAPPPRRLAAEVDAQAPKAQRENEAGFRDERARQVPASQLAAPREQQQTQQSVQLGAQQGTQQGTQQGARQALASQAAPQFQARDQAAPLTAGAGAAVGAAAGASADAQRKDVAGGDAKLDSMKKKLEEVAKTQPAVVTTGAAESRRMEASAARGPTILSMDDSSRQQCFREAQPPMGFEPIQRVLRMNDTMAFPLSLRDEARLQAQSPPRANALAAPPLSRAPARVLPAVLRVKGDTLFLPNPNNSISRAIKVNCPRP